MKMEKSKVFYWASLASVALSIAAWTICGDADPAYSERWGIFVGLWAPTLMGMAIFHREK
tara:strand:- start:47 stop:226 length:180 start_codon:yes stop_codon:yes gene_type:complete